MDALTTKVDKQAVLLANQVVRTANIASSISNVAKETHATAQSVEYSNTLVKQLIDELKKPEEKGQTKQAHIEPETQRLPPLPPPPHPTKLVPPVAIESHMDKPDGTTAPRAPKESHNKIRNKKTYILIGNQ